ncbi:MAG: rod shape-determining protein MreC [Clostridia bacterium]|nr:rod shape-determining protein MreC [Clostridia bacterium]
MRSFFRKKIVIAVLVVISAVIVLGVLSAYSVGRASPVADAASFLTSPFQKAFAWAAGGVGKVISYVTEFDALKLENERLKAELLEKSELIREAEQYRDENAKLRDLLNITRENEEYSMQMCDIIARSDGDYARTFTINKGSSSGIEVGDTVIVSEGYVGTVCELGLNWANVQTVIDSGNSLGAQNVRTNESMICEGDFELMKKGRLKLAYVTLETSLYVGDEICTSGLGKNVPQGIMIGEVSAISTSRDGYSKIAEITPSVDLDKLTVVFVITDFQKEG